MSHILKLVAFHVIQSINGRKYIYADHIEGAVRRYVESHRMDISEDGIQEVIVLVRDGLSRLNLLRPEPEDT